MNETVLSCKEFVSKNIGRWLNEYLQQDRCLDSFINARRPTEIVSVTCLDVENLSYKDKVENFTGNLVTLYAAE